MTSTESRFAFFGIMLGIADRIDARSGRGGIGRRAGFRFQ
jgi:hypothetical protein